MRGDINTEQQKKTQFFYKLKAKFDLKYKQQAICFILFFFFYSYTPKSKQLSFSQIIDLL